MKSISFMMLTSTLLIVLHSTPMSLLISILLQTTSICFLSSSLLSTSWFAFILFIIYLGGLMVLFIYIVSLASNEKLNIKISLPNLFIFSFLILLTTTSLMNFMEPSFIKMKFILNFNSMFNLSSLKLIMLTMLYLLFSLITIIKICNKFEGPLKLLII